MRISRVYSGVIEPDPISPCNISVSVQTRTYTLVGTWSQVQIMFKFHLKPLTLNNESFVTQLYKRPFRTHDMTV